jgi:hypothetical protein
MIGKDDEGTKPACVIPAKAGIQPWAHDQTPT